MEIDNMKHRFASKSDIIRAFSGSMNLISSEVEDHHEKMNGKGNYEN